MRHCSLMVRNLLMQHIGSPQHICITGPGEFSRAGFQIKGMVFGSGAIYLCVVSTLVNFWQALRSRTL